MMAAEAFLSHSFALLMTRSMLALFNHVSEICAMGSEVFKKHPGPFVKDLLKT